MSSAFTTRTYKPNEATEDLLQSARLYGPWDFDLLMDKGDFAENSDDPRYDFDIADQQIRDGLRCDIDAKLIADHGYGGLVRGKVVCEGCGIDHYG